jgi:hypothetical protein
MQKKTVLPALSLAITLSAAPLAFSPGQGVSIKDACAQTVKNPGTGTCCPQHLSVCITPHGNLYNYYYKSDGAC